MAHHTPMLTCILGFAACGGPEDATFTGPEPVLPPQIESWSLVAEPSVPLVRTVEVTLESPAEVTLLATASDGTELSTSSDSGLDHRLTLLMLRPDTTYDLEVIASNEEGTASATDVIAIDPLPANLPQITVHVSSPDRTPGVYLMPITKDDRSGTWVAVLDGDGALLWLYDASGARFHEVLPTERGIRGISGSNIIDVGWDGTLHDVWRASELTGVDGSGFHHEVFEDADGRLVTLIEREAIADDLPISYSDPTPQDPVAIGFDEVVSFELDGSDVQRTEVTSLLDTSRIGWDSLRDVSGIGRLDWGRANSVFPDEPGDDWIVSLRHQDAVIAIDRSSGELEWILANPAQWPPDLEAKRLQPVGDVQWSYHQHAAQLLSDGCLVVFDNGNHRTTPLAGEVETEDVSWYSRVVCYRIDRQAGTVTQEWEWQPLPTLFSSSQGDVDELPSGNLLVDFAYVQHEGGVTNEQQNIGTSRTRLMEVDVGSGEVLFDVELWEEGTGFEHAWYAYRAEHMSEFPPL